MSRFSCVVLVFACLSGDVVKCLPPLSDPQAMDRILHGAISDITEHPYQVALVTNRHDKEKIVCGGALVSPRLVYTAAHCTHIGDRVKRPNLYVLLGANSLSDPDGRRHKIAKVVRHPQFTYSKFDNDFSVIVLKKPAELGLKVQPISVAHGRLQAGTKGTVSGWGRTETGSPSHFLRAVGVTVERPAKCKQYFPVTQHPNLTKNMFCIKPAKKGTSFGDSGSPFVIDGQLVGLVSFGRNFEGGNKVTVFTKVKNFADLAPGVNDFFI